MNPTDYYDRNDMTDAIANHKTENATSDELESAYYESQYAKIDEWTDDEVLEAYKTIFPENFDND